ncbi:hypothetical protein Bca52824_054520 [Brassica carinata]|uniref:Uncharacterized protein n=1 Tax=Brassica carinata TaxID=52824 RepID=A0A8X7R9Z7_BRACI|nr:hypothetical protein Bca52824_054520 [Brassica carinata]
MMIRFGESTSFDEITEPAIPIGVESFRFRDHSELLGLANTNTLLPGETYFYRLVAQDTRLPSAAPLLKSYANVESLSIAELNEFIISASSQEIDFICTGKVTGIKLDKGLCYVSCSNCTKSSKRFLL